MPPCGGKGKFCFSELRGGFGPHTPGKGSFAPRSEGSGGGYAPPDPAVQVLWGLPAPTPWGSLLDAQK